MKYRINEVIPFSDESLTERGERVFTHVKITAYPPAQNPIGKVINCDNGLGFTEEWIEDTVKGCLAGLAKDFPNDAYRVVRVKPNEIEFRYSGVAGLVN